MPEVRRLRVNSTHKLHSPHMLALRTIATKRQMVRQPWLPFLSTITGLRGKSFAWVARSLPPTNQNVRRWLRATPILHDWVMSDQCLVSPKEWPPEVLPAFRYRLIPSPFQIANVDMLYKYTRTQRAFRGHLAVLLYCMGLTLEDISEGYLMTKREVLLMMYHAIEGWQSVPQYIIWASATDFRAAMIPSFIQELPRKKRGRFLAALLSNPFSADELYCQQLIQRTSYLSYLIYGSPKRPRLTPGCRVYRTQEAFDGKEKESRSSP